jgi:hypothetical protein
MAVKHGREKMHIVDLIAILNESLKTLPDDLPVEVMLEDGSIVEIGEVKMRNGSLCLIVKPMTVYTIEWAETCCREEALYWVDHVADPHSVYDATVGAVIMSRKWGASK